MKQFFLLLLIAISLVQLPLRAQDSNTASAIAEKQEAEERYKRLSADVESLLAANLALQKKISTLDAELQKVREEQQHSAKNNSTTETVKKLADAIQEVDRNREADKKKILDEIAKLGKTLAATPPRTSTKPTIVAETGSGPEKVFPPYIVQSGDTLGAILADYNALLKSKGMKTITMKQVEAANPNVDWNKLKIGQKIFIPAPE